MKNNTWQKMAEDADSQCAHFTDLPAELQQLCLEAQVLRADDIARASCCCRSLQLLCGAAARHRLVEVLPASCDASMCPCPLWALHNCTLLSDAIGPVPSDKTWRDEWPHLRLSQARMLATNNGRAEAFEQQVRSMTLAAALDFFRDENMPGCITTESRQSYASSIHFKRSAGWSEERALEVSLLASRCATALAHAIRTGQRAYAASCWTVCAALWERAWSVHGDADAEPVPPYYAHLDGEFGLATDDSAWDSLRADGAVEGSTRFRISGLPFAHEANSAVFPDGRGYYVPITGRGSVSYELADSDIVRFISRDTAAWPFSYCRSLLKTDECIGRLPPFAMVTLERVWAPGEWFIENEPINRRCYDVTVEF